MIYESMTDLLYFMIWKIYGKFMGMTSANWGPQGIEEQPSRGKSPVAMALATVALVETPVRATKPRPNVNPATFADDFDGTPVKHVKPKRKPVKLDGNAVKDMVVGVGAKAAVPPVPSFEDVCTYSSKSSECKSKAIMIKIKQTQPQSLPSEKLVEKSLVSLANTSLKPVSKVRYSQRQIIHGWW